MTPDHECTEISHANATTVVLNWRTALNGVCEVLFALGKVLGDDADRPLAGEPDCR